MGGRGKGEITMVCLREGDGEVQQQVHLHAASDIRLQARREEETLISNGGKSWDLRKTKRDRSILIYLSDQF